MTLPRVLTEPLGGSKLSLAMQSGAIPAIGKPWPTSPDEWRGAATAVRTRFKGDAWWRELAPAFGDSSVLPSLTRAARDGVVVTTGQQAGLFGGHLLTLVKALSARALASTLESATGLPCATVFWAATDDADFVEAASVVIPATGEAKTLTLSQAPPAGTPMAKAPLRGFEPLLEQMAACCGSSGDETMAMLRRAYREGRTVGDSYVDFLRDLLSPLGIAVIDASHPAVRHAARPLLKQALLDAAMIDQRINADTASLRKAGLLPQVESVPGLSLVFANEQGIKRRIPITEAKAVAGSDTELSPTVLLRPLVEAAILPTIAYAGGPGELAYFAQIPSIADALRAARPTAVPRWSTTVVETGIDRILDRYGVTPTELADYDGLLTRLVRDQMPAELAKPLARLNDEIGRVAGELLGAAKRNGIDDKVIEGLRAQLALRAGRGERRIVAALKRREHDLVRDLGTARASLYPNGLRQERALSFVPFVARYNGALLDRMLAEATHHAERLVGAR